MLPYVGCTNLCSIIGSVRHCKVRLECNKWLMLATRLELGWLPTSQRALDSQKGDVVIPSCL